MRYSQQILTGAALAYVSLMAARAVVRSRRKFCWRNKIALITGGSRGLGLVLGRELVREGVRVAICSRDGASVQRAVEDLQSQALNSRVIGLQCDVRSTDEVEHTVEEIQKQWGDIELLFNVAGIIDVGPFEAMSLQDFENAMNVNCWGALRTTQCVLPGMRRKGWGRIVNVASIGGKRAVPHMLPYAASKFALVGLSHGLRAELKQHNIFVTAACPSLMITGSPRNANFKGQHRAEYAWFAVGDALPIVSMSAENAARQIMDACQQGRGEVLISNLTNISTYLQGLFPELSREILEFTNRLLPEMGGTGKTKAGRDSESWITRSFLTHLSQQAAIRNNEMMQG